MPGYMSDLEQFIFHSLPSTGNFVKASVMSNYEIGNLILTGLYDFLTLGLLVFVAYEALIKPKKPLVVLSLRAKPSDTEPSLNAAHFLDFVIDNRGSDITNLSITSTPDQIQWGKDTDAPGKSTSEYFHSTIPGVTRNDQLSFFWCDGKKNLDVISQPIKITVEYDNPSYPWTPLLQKRCRSNLIVNLKVYENIYWGINRKYDIHNVAEELSRLRKDLKNYFQR